MKVISLPEIVSRIRCRRSGKTFLSEFINQCKIEDAIIIPEGATNGDMIKAMFSNTKIEGIGGLEGLQCVAVSIGLGTSYFALDWWNAPYKAGSEDSK